MTYRVKMNAPYGRAHFPSDKSYFEGREDWTAGMHLADRIDKRMGLEDFTELVNISKEYVDEIYNGSPADIKEVYRDILWTLFQKMNVPVDEARDKMTRLEDGGIGDLFASMEKMDIQAERRNTQLVRQELEEARQELKKASDRFDIFFSHMVSICQSQGMSRDETFKSLQEQYGLEEEEALSAIQHYYGTQN